MLLSMEDHGASSWPVLPAVLTLRNINARRGFSAGNEVKISRRAVRVSAAVVRVQALLEW